MANASNPNDIRRSGSQARGAKYRIDPSHSAMDQVPVLFRLRHLHPQQEMEPVAAAATNRSRPQDEAEVRSQLSGMLPSTEAQLAQEREAPYRGFGTRASAAATASASSVNQATSSSRPSSPSATSSAATGAGASAIKETTGGPSVPPAKTNKAPDAMTSPGKHGIANGYVLIFVIVIAAFAIGRNSQRSSSSVAVAPSTTPVPASADPLPKTETPALAHAPLVAPRLPGESDVSPTSTEDSRGEDDREPSLVSNDPSTAPKSAVPSASETPAGKDQALLTTAAIDANKDRIEIDELELPATLEGGKVEGETQVDGSVAKVDSPSTSPTDDKTDALLATNLASSGSTETKPAAVTSVEANKNDNQPRLVATKTPDGDFDEYYQFWANYQSQKAALARALQPAPSGVPAQVAAGSTGPYTVAQPVGYGNPIPAAAPSPTQGNMLPPAGFMPSNPGGYGVPSTASGTPTAPSNPAATVPPGGYSVPSTAPAPTQPYQPLYSVPPQTTVNPYTPPSDGNAGTTPRPTLQPYQPLGPTLQATGF